MATLSPTGPLRDPDEEEKRRRAVARPPGEPQPPARPAPAPTAERRTTQAPSPSPSASPPRATDTGGSQPAPRQTVSTGTVPPPPPPPPPPTRTVTPEEMRRAQATGTPIQMTSTTVPLGAPTGGGGFDFAPVAAPQNPGLFEDFDLSLYLDEILSGQAPTPTAAPERTGPQMGEVVTGPQYETAEGAFQGEEWSPELAEYVRNLMENPNVYAEGFVADSLGVINADIDRQRSDAMRGLDERMAARGTVAGSPDLLEGYDIATRLAEVEAARKNELAQMIGQAELAGRSLGLQGGMSMGDFLRGLGNDRRSEGQFQWTADRTTGRDAEDDARFRAQFGEQQHQADVSANLQRDALALDAYRTDLNAGLQATQMRLQELGMKADEAFRYASLGTDTAFRNEAMRLQALGLSLDQAFRQAELDLRGELGRGELDIRRQESEAQIKAMDFNKIVTIGNFIMSAIDAGIPPEELEGIVQGFVSGEISEEDLVEMGQTAVTNRPPRNQWEELGLPGYGDEEGEEAKAKDGTTYVWRFVWEGNQRTDGYWEKKQN